jgi:probable rRNA maturation factor
MTRPARKACRIEVLVQSGLWKEPGKAKTVLRRAVRAAAAALSTSDAELAIVLSDDSAVRVLNRQWRGIDKATNVLSFPTETREGEPPLLGDIVLAYETIAREARNEGKPFAHHLAHLAVHGFLHLNGYDHERDDDAEAMEELERGILRRLAIADPYRPRAGLTGRPARKTAGKSAGKSAKAR